MRSHKLLLVGASLSVVLTALAVLGAVRSWWWLAVLSAMVLISATLMIAIDTDRRTRELRAFVRSQVASIDTTGGRAAPTTEDVVGTVRVLQAQYTARLDRLQDSVEDALRQLR
ncbi:hypothetical protein [Ornithinimicrobium panacihumi]|uniref:hypothetical protein n=1 Tax=Ornithinimicrobium panacihumi TaxID=2008449 RepID=UPI003F88FC2C